MQGAPFQLQGLTVTFTGAATAPTPVQALGGAGTSSQNYVVSNRGSVDVFMSCEATAAAATSSAVIPTGTGQRVHVIPYLSQVTIGGPANAFFTGVTASGTAVVYVTPGEGQ